MELEDVSEVVEWETRRVAAAFGIEDYQCVDPTANERGYAGASGAYCFEWYLNTYNLENVVLHFIGINFTAAEAHVPEGIRCALARHSPATDAPWDWYELPGERVKELIARVLYRLGFEEGAVYTQLRVELTIHEKMELRLSMTREFWPRKWLDKEPQSSANPLEEA